MLSLMISLAVAFLIGSIPFAVVAMWGTGVDIRKVGSRNPGFNNVLRVSTKARAAVALVGDVTKGLVAVALLTSSGDPAWRLWLVGVAAVAGHCWSPFLGFNGGKGVATTVGVVVFVTARIAVPCLILYPVIRRIGRMRGWKQEGAIASLSTMFVISCGVLIFDGVEAGGFAFVMLAIVLARHVPNLREIF